MARIARSTSFAALRRWVRTPGGTISSSANHSLSSISAARLNGRGCLAICRLLVESYQEPISVELSVCGLKAGERSGQRQVPLVRPNADHQVVPFLGDVDLPSLREWGRQRQHVALAFLFYFLRHAGVEARRGV